MKRIGSIIKILACVIMLALATVAIYQPGAKRKQGTEAEVLCTRAGIRSCHFFIGFL